MAHRQGSGADKALPADSEPQALDRTADWIRAIQHPHGFAMSRGRLQDVAQRSDEGIDSATQVLQIDEEGIEGIHHRIRRLAHLAIQAEDRDAMHRIVEVGRFDHVVLLVAAQTMLRTESCGELYVAARGQRVERMRQVLRDRSGVREQGYAPALERRAQSGLSEKSIDAEFHNHYAAGSSWAKQSK